MTIEQSGASDDVAKGAIIVDPPQARSASDQGELEIIRMARLSPSQIAAARAEQQRSGASFLDALIALNIMSREKLMAALSKRYNYPILQANNENEGVSRSLVVGYEPFGESAEQFRSIRSALVATSIAKGIRSLAVIAPRQNVGASYFASNLAMAFAQMSVATLLVDANLRSPSIAQMLGLAPKCEGLSEALQNGAANHVAINRNVISGLSVLTSGTTPPNPQELLAGEHFFTLTTVLNQEFGIVIYDAPPALECSDAYVLASRCDAAIIVARRNETKFEELRIIKDKLRMMECSVVGAVLNEF